MRRSLIIQFQFEGWHRWPSAPKEHAYLRHPHRHVFHVKAEMDVEHVKRQVEFIALKRKVSAWTESKFKKTTFSCEQMAEDIAYKWNFCRVEVYEDGENGGAYERK